MTPSPDARSPSRAVGRVKNVAGWSSPVAREAHNLEVTGSNPVPATFFTPAGPSMAPAGCFFGGLLPPFTPAGPSMAPAGCLLRGRPASSRSADTNCFPGTTAASEMQTDDVISTADAADIMGVSQTWVGNKINEGTPEGVRLHSRGVPVSCKSAFKNTLA